MNGKYSYKDFLNKKFTDTPAEEWNDTEVIGTCFAQEKPKTKVFPDEIKGVTFTKCNLDNCIVPETCTINGGTHKWIGVQNDLEDWILDESLNPVEPVDKARFVRLGLSISPLAISASKLEIPATQAKRVELEAQYEADKAAALASIEAAANVWRK